VFTFFFVVAVQILFFHSFTDVVYAWGSQVVIYIDFSSSWCSNILRYFLQLLDAWL
jgi:hypothetical protein